MQETNKTHTAWRFNGINGRCSYVEEINYSGKGDRYSYTSEEAKALKMSEKQCRDFCSYMRQCGTVGFWS